MSNTRRAVAKGWGPGNPEFDERNEQMGWGVRSQKHQEKDRKPRLQKKKHRKYFKHSRGREKPQIIKSIEQQDLKDALNDI